MQQSASNHSSEKKEPSSLQSDNIPVQNNTQDVVRQKQNLDQNILPESQIQKKEGDDNDQLGDSQNNQQSEITQKQIVQADKLTQNNPIQQSLNLKTENQEGHNPTQIRTTLQQFQSGQQKIVVGSQQKREKQQEQSQDKKQLRQQNVERSIQQDDERTLNIDRNQQQNAHKTLQQKLLKSQTQKENKKHEKQLREYIQNQNDSRKIETNKTKPVLIFKEDDPDQVELYNKQSKQEEYEDNKDQKIPKKNTVTVKLPEQKAKKEKNTQAKAEKKKEQSQDKTEKKAIKKQKNKKSTTKKKTQKTNIIKSQQKPITEDKSQKKQEKNQKMHIEDNSQDKQLKLIHNKSQPQKNNNQNGPDDNLEQINIKSSILPTTASILHQEPAIQPEISNDVIIKSAQKERLTTVYTLLNQYLQTHFKYQKGHEACLINLENQINRKKGMKLLLLYNMREFFINMLSMCKQFYQQSYKYQYSVLQEQPQNDNSNCYNPGINIRKQWNKGFQELIYLRKSVGNDFSKQNQFIQKQLVQSLNKLFQDYDLKVGAELQKIIEKKQTYRQKWKEFHKQITKINKVYYKEMEDKKHNDDLFVQIVRFVNIQAQLRKLLIKWGKTIIQARNQYIIHEELLFSNLQKLLNAYRNSNKALFEGGKQINYFNKVIQLTKQIKSSMEFNILCPITDIDYIKCVQSLDERQKKQMTNRDFSQFIQLLYFKRLVGDASSLLKGITGKQFQLKDKEERIINTIAGNLVRFNKNTCQLKDKFYVKHISAKIVQQGIVEIKEITPGVFFDSQRTVRLTFKDNDRAEEIITFLSAVE